MFLDWCSNICLELKMTSHIWNSYVADSRSANGFGYIIGIIKSKVGSDRNCASARKLWDSFWLPCWLVFPFSSAASATTDMGSISGDELTQLGIQGSSTHEEKIFVAVRLRPLNDKEAVRNDVSEWECVSNTTIMHKNASQERSMFPTAYTFGKQCSSVLDLAKCWNYPSTLCYCTQL